MARTGRPGRHPSDQVARLLRSYEALAKEQAEVKAQLVKLAPAWAELRKVLNELNRVLEPWRARTASVMRRRGSAVQRRCVDELRVRATGLGLTFECDVESAVVRS